MRQIRVLCILVLFLFSLACSDDSTGGHEQNGSDATDASHADAVDKADAREEVGDARQSDARAEEEEDITDADRDADVTEDEVDDATEEDVQDAADAIDEEDSGDTGDSSSDDYAGRPLGQCTENSDCPDGPMGQGICSRALPGGACMSCGNDSHCPSGSSCSDYGSCVGDCNADEQCAPGLRCLSSGICAAILCSDNSECPSLFVCSGGTRGQCERTECAGDASTCPDATTCVDGRCIEDRAL